MRSSTDQGGPAFDGHDRRRLARALAAASDVRSYRRTLAVLGVARGRSPADVAGDLGVTPRAVHKWAGRYLAGGRRAADLSERPRSGRPRAAPAVTDAVIARALASDPMAAGFMATTWTVNRLATHLGRTLGCRLSPRTLRRRVRAMGLRWKRPRHAYKAPAPHLPQKKGRSSAGWAACLAGRPCCSSTRRSCGCSRR